MASQPTSVDALLKDQIVTAGLREAWFDSEPGLAGGHEEGGFILHGRYRIARWPRGGTDRIEVPEHPDCYFDGDAILATFHTHPNIGDDYAQSPGRTDMRAVRDDPQLKGEQYAGEFAIAAQDLFLVTPRGEVQTLGPAAQLLNLRQRDPS